MIITWTLLVACGLAYAARPYGLTTDPQAFASNSYDYLIVGGGNAGLTVAARLSESSNVTVGVIEAGPYYPNDPLVTTPFLLGEAVNNQSYDWSLQTVPQANVSNRILGTSIGRMLGGSSALNFMTYGRASAEEYDIWQSLGNTGWTWDNLLSYFKKSETVTPGQAGIFPGTSGPPGTDTTYEGQTGPVQVDFNTNATYVTALLAPFVNSFYAVGAFPNANPDSGNATGLLQSPRSVDQVTGQRSYSASAFFAPNQNRTNLLILTGAVVSKVVLAKQGGSVIASGVEYYANSTKYSVNATKEVHLAAGAVKTPQLLELSGIGNSTLLTSLNITTLVDLPGVGENFQDHTLIGSDFLLKEPAPITWDAVKNNATFAAQQQQQYATSHDGMYASTNAAISFHPLQQFINSSEFSAYMNQLDLEIAQASTTPLQQAQYTIQKQLLVEGKVGQIEIAMAPGGGKVDTDVPVLANRSYISIMGVTSRPFSRGSVHINTTDYSASPVIDPRYYSFSLDSQIMTLALTLARRIAEAEPLASYIDRQSSPPSNITSDADLLSWVQDYTISVYHPVGTAPLAPQNIGGVVDENLHVYGTSNLRVIDASVIPFLMASHTQSTVYAVAERVSDLIKAGQ